MKLSEIQIQELYKFTRKHFVEHYDLQTELVDHLANGIEEQWKENKHISFEEALKKEFKKFGVFGFGDVIDRHARSLSKKYFKLIFKFLKEYLKLPKIIFTTFAVLLVFSILRFSGNSFLILSITFGVFAVYMFYNVIVSRKQYNKRVKQTGKRWKLEEMIFTATDGSLLVFNFFQLFYYGKLFESENYITQFILAIVLVFVALFLYITSFVLKEKAENLLTEAYPEYELLK